MDPPQCLDRTDATQPRNSSDDDMDTDAAQKWVDFRVCVLEAENERLRDEISALRSQLASALQGSPATSLTWERETVTTRIMLQEMSASLAHEQERVRVLEQEKRLHLQDIVGVRDKDDRERAREMVLLQQQLIDAKMALAHCVGEQEQQFLVIKAHEMALSQTKLELAQVSSSRPCHRRFLVAI